VDGRDEPGHDVASFSDLVNVRRSKRGMIVEHGEQNSACPIAAVAVVEQLSARCVVGKVRRSQIRGRSIVTGDEIRAGDRARSRQTREAREQNVDRVGAMSEIHDVSGAFARGVVPTG
jgi:hypothetical protein